MTPDFLRGTRATSRSSGLGWVKNAWEWLRGRQPTYHTLNAPPASSVPTPASRSSPCKSFRWQLIPLTLLAAILLVSVFNLARRSIYEADDSDEAAALWRVSPAAVSLQRKESNLRRDRELQVPPRLAPCTSDDPCHFVMVADLDEKVTPNSPFRTFFFPGSLALTPGEAPQLRFHPPPHELQSMLGEGQRGMELSEVILFKNHLYAFDDRTGAVLEYTKRGHLIPKRIVTEGDGETGKGYKIEWATEKDGFLWVGSFGKEYTDKEGKRIFSEANFWVVILDERGNIVERKNWKPIFQSLRKRLGCEFPGYLLHEAINWSPHLKKWVLLPRRVSLERYDETKDETRGSNVVLIASEDFSEIRNFTAGDIVPERGFSSFKFVPGTEDRLILALKSVEIEKLEEQHTFVTVFETLTGKVLLPDTEVPHAVKYEGIEFVPPNAPYHFMLNYSG